MHRSDASEPVGLDAARARIVSAVTPTREDLAVPGKVGLEPEVFVFRPRSGGLPRRLPLAGEGSVLATVDELIEARQLAAVRQPGETPVYALTDGSRLTFEPAGQLEHSTAVFMTAAEALDAVDEVARALDDGFARRGARLASIGIDPWNPVESVPQQLEAARYRSMAAYFAARGREGAVMMRNTCSVQVNLDLGRPGVDAERFLLANLLSPVSTASFACSPVDGMASRRAAAWQGLDPTRTGYPARLLVEGKGDPGEQYADFALDADVLVFRRGPEGGLPGTPGFSLRAWIERGHPEHGPATAADLDYHMSTLFPEVRLRGFFEVRSIDAVPAPWRAAAVVFWCGLLYDEEARIEATALLEPSRGDLPDLWMRSAREGLGDPELRASARRLWTIAMSGASRLPDGFLRAEHLSRADEFRRRFVVPGRSPAVELEQVLRLGADHALAWAAASDVVVDSE